MRIAIFQNFLDTVGGAEVVGLTLARELNADLYTTNINREKIEEMGFADVRIKSIGRVPVNAPFRQQMVLWRFRKLNLKNKYDFFIINGDWAVSAAIHNKPNLWYVNATIREIWDLYDYTRARNVPFFLRPIFDIWIKYNRYLNKKHVKNIGKIASNSTFTKERVKKYLDRESVLIYPPTQTAKYHYEKNGDYWLSVNRLIMYKRVDLQIKAFAKMPDKKLVIVGPYEKSRHCQAYADYIKKMKPPNVILLHKISPEGLVDLYANCKGFITTCYKEDFGMTPVEAMASGKPVIAPNEGGYRETIIDGITGRLIDNINVDKLIRAVKEMEGDTQRYKEACLGQAKKFDVQIFIKKIKELIKE
jgi:glycosyltransferase involved in cell wall biosynthesis